MNYQSLGSAPVHIDSQIQTQDLRAFELTGKKEFYLFGTLPKEHNVNVDKMVTDAGMLNASKVVIEEYTTYKNLLWRAISLGLYTPVNYRVSGYGKMAVTHKSHYNRVIRREGYGN